jgi:NAD-dependent dihydropyrimidine dehydrogenase PreA subunit
MLITLLIPFFMVLGGWTGARLHENLARVNGTVRMAEEVLDAQTTESGAESIEMTAFRASGKSTETLYREAAELLQRFYIGGWILGAFIGLSVGAMIAGMLLRRYRTDYEPNRGTCFSCARCVDYCPVKPEPTIHG